eukprot:11522675-Ditylum_brightwellii.AAC.1
MMEKMRGNYFNNKGKELGDESDFRQQGSMKADSFTIKDKIVYDMNSLQMVGFSDKAWNHVDAIAS